METLDTITLFELPKTTSAEIPSTDSGDDNNGLVIGDKELSDDDAVAKCTRSRTRMVFSASALNLEKPKASGPIILLKLVTYLVLFFLYNSVVTTSSSRPVGDIPDLGKVET